MRPFNLSSDIHLAMLQWMRLSIAELLYWKPGHHGYRHIGDKKQSWAEILPSSGRSLFLIALHDGYMSLVVIRVGTGY